MDYNLILLVSFLGLSFLGLRFLDNRNITTLKCNLTTPIQGRSVLYAKTHVRR